MSNSDLLKKLTELTNEKSKDVLKTINAITDEQSFVESDKFILSQTDFGDAVGEGVVSGFGQIDDVQVGIFATNPAVLKGSIGKQNSKKIVKCINSAIEIGAPIIGILDTCGARFNEGIEAMEGYSSIFKAFSAAYGTVPTVLVVKGNNFGLLSYLTNVCDVCIAYEKAVIASSSPLILAAQSKIDVSKVGTTAVHTKSGLISSVVKSDAELKTIISKYLRYLTDCECECSDDGNRQIKYKAGQKLKDVIISTVDEGSLLEIRSGFGTEAITAFARLNGMSVGIIGCEGKLSSNGAVKISEFLVTCESFSIPVISFVNCDGAVNDLPLENCCLIGEIANMLYSLNLLTVPKIAIITGSAIGLGYTAFASKSIYDYSMAFVDASINSISDIAAANLLYSQEIGNAKDKDKAAQKLAAAYGEENSSAMAVAQKGFIDNIIDPTFVRPYIIAALQMYINKR